MAGTWRWTSAVGLAVFFAVMPASTKGDNSLPPFDTQLPGEDALVAAAEPSASTCERYKTRSWMRKKLVGDRDMQRYGLRMADGWEQSSTDHAVVVLVHGFNSTPAQNLEIMKPIHSASRACGTFAYPNDHSIPASAVLLSCELRRFAKMYPERRIVLICHSMGSLVARACIENPQLDPRNVVRLIMIAPPTHGSLIANFAVGTDVWEHWIARKHGGPWQRMRDSIVDGLGEAADELCPGSDFLTELNGRPLNANVRYTVLLGTGARMDEEQIAWIRDSVCNSLARLPGGGHSAERLAEILNDIDELVVGKGDGVVAVKRGRLEGVSDTIVLPFGHLAVTSEPRSEVLKRVQHIVLERVQ